MSKRNRRQFLEESLLAAAAAAAYAAKAMVAAEDSPRVTANDKIGAAIIGCGIRGKAHARGPARQEDCEIVYVCDPDRDRAAEVAALVVEQGRPSPKVIQDLRKALDDRSVDVAFVATPNHWHALAAIWAMQAGQDASGATSVSHNG